MIISVLPNTVNMYLLFNVKGQSWKKRYDFTQYLLGCQGNRQTLILLYNSLTHKSTGVNLEWAVELLRKVITLTYLETNHKRRIINLIS